MKTILASASPRRRELLTLMGMQFEIIPSKGEEIITKQIPSEVVMELAEQKASEVADRLIQEKDCVTGKLMEDFADDKPGQSDFLIIGADTVVVKNYKILGKPKDKEDAVCMLQSLSGDTHQVYTGVCLIRRCGNKISKKTFFESTNVTFCSMTNQEILDYVDTGDPLDKAGAYGIQGICGKYISGIEGDYNNVVGLPIARLYQELKDF